MDKGKRIYIFGHWSVYDGLFIYWDWRNDR